MNPNSSIIQKLKSSISQRMGISMWIGSSQNMSQELLLSSSIMSEISERFSPDERENTIYCMIPGGRETLSRTVLCLVIDCCIYYTSPVPHRRSYATLEYVFLEQGVNEEYHMKSHMLMETTASSVI